MAHGFRCKRCKHQETEHRLRREFPDACAEYRSPDPDAERRLWDAEKVGPEPFINHDVWMILPGGILANIGG